MSKSIIQISGKTIDESFTFGNVFTLVGTHGLPLDVVLSYFKDSNLTVDWIDYIQSAINDGAKLDGVKVKILTAVADVYGRDYKKKFEEAMNKIDFEKIINFPELVKFKNKGNNND
jgi:alanyl-tRNA synthetase